MDDEETNARECQKDEANAQVMLHEECPSGRSLIFTARATVGRVPNQNNCDFFLFFERTDLRRLPRGGNIFPLGGKGFRPGEHRSPVIQPLGKGVAQEVNPRRREPVSEELQRFHDRFIGFVNS